MKFPSLLLGLHLAEAATLGSRTAHKPKTSQGSWTRQSLIGQGPRQEHSVTSIGSDIYLVGGVAYDSLSVPETLNRVEYYNTEDKSWHVAAPLPVPLNHGNTATVDGKIYLLGSLSGAMDWVAMNSSYVYQPFNDTITPMPNGTARGSSAMGVRDSKIYVAGGMTILQAYEGGHQDSVSMVSSYDTLTDSWDIDYPPLPEPRQHVGGAVISSTFYVIGGRENGIHQYHNTTYALDLDNPVEWKELSPMPTARGSLACAAVGKKIYCFGGEGDRSNPQQIFHETEVYDTTTDSWETLLPMEVPRHGTGATAVGNKVYIPGGGVTSAFYPVGIMDAFVVDGEA
ncbi:uncharacterized protein LTR77_009548 [Saxophila tyrrhenica]|uniref:Galactose oxidase n=1 Tax=Saxophila tyrrhenica TaxID=1690608 RepID=A0AAV9NXZ4_9PEZI|nr:hypothetical protein LTR77_009548 [Saxophila tyrrhenica]